MIGSHHMDLFAVLRELARALRGAALLVATAGFALVGSAADQQTNAFYRAEGTRRMAEQLEQIARTVDPLGARFLSAGQVEVWRRRMAERPELARDSATRFQLAEALLNSARNMEALAEFEA